MKKRAARDALAWRVKALTKPALPAGYRCGRHCAARIFVFAFGRISALVDKDPAAAAHAPRAPIADQEFQLRARALRLFRIHGEKPRAAAVGQLRLAAADGRHGHAAVGRHRHHRRHALVADKAAREHFRIGERPAHRHEPAVRRLEGQPHGGVVERPHQLIHVRVALVAQHGEAPILAEQQPAL